jgi:hypothetical protein
MECMEKTSKYCAVRTTEMYPAIDPGLF